MAGKYNAWPGAGLSARHDRGAGRAVDAQERYGSVETPQFRRFLAQCVALEERSDARVGGEALRDNDIAAPACPSRRAVRFTAVPK